MATIRRIESAEPGAIDGLCALLIDAVHDGASVGFLAPLSRETALRYWTQALASPGEGLVLWIAESGGEVVGTVQLNLCAKDNGRHRAELQKLLVLDTILAGSQSLDEGRARLMGGYVTVWEFRVHADRRTEFEEHYGPAGAWAALFRCAEGYLGTELLHDRNDALHYLTIDRWATADAYRSFHARFAEQYASLDRACGGLTAHEAVLGEYDDPVRR
ncbi:MAG: antibiotic biosynthesis monooxygenase [Steroidobacteraceae bacterium]